MTRRRRPCWLLSLRVNKFAACLDRTS